MLARRIGTSNSTTPSQHRTIYNASEKKAQPLLSFASTLKKPMRVLSGWVISARAMPKVGVVDVGFCVYTEEGERSYATLTVQSKTLAGQMVTFQRGYR